MAGYVELHCHSAYSFLDGASQPEELAVRAVELGYEALALTDHDGVYGSLEFAYAAKALGLRSITGAEATLAEAGYYMLLTDSDHDPAREARFLRLLRSRRVDGIILYLSDEDDPVVQGTIADLDVPVVVRAMSITAARPQASPTRM